MFIDELEIYAKAGDGGDGVVRWRHEKYKPNAGPAGGNGGNGGDVYVRGVRDMNVLQKYTGNKRFIAPNGESGRKKSQHGKGSDDLYIDVPIGSTVIDLERDRHVQVLEDGDSVRILKGGQGGLGNENFKSSTNQTPLESTPGKPGEEGHFRIEVALMADVGLIGEPNAGKSTLLQLFTNASSAIGAYPFTTLEPHLGKLFEFTIADIPGLIEGAASGKGLGHKFLRHVTRTSMLLHLVSLEQLDPLATYAQIRRELEAFDASLGKKTEWVVLTKADLATDEVVSAVQLKFQALSVPVFVISEHDDASLKALRDALVQHLRDEVV